jgi:hypothetical protein
MNIRKSVFNAGLLQQKEPKNPATPTILTPESWVFHQLCLASYQAHASKST